MKNIKAKCLLVSLPDMEKDPGFPAKMNELANELERVFKSAIGEEVEVVLWNTNVKFVSPLEITQIIKQLKKKKENMLKE